MNLLRIAARVAATRRASELLVLNGPFKQSSPDEETEVTIPFGLDGAIVPVLVEAIGYAPGDPVIPEVEEEIRRGPNEDISIGYWVKSEKYYPAERETRDYPGARAEYEMDIEITHFMGYELSGEDKVAANRELNELVRDHVQERHEESYNNREPDFDEDDYR